MRRGVVTCSVAAALVLASSSRPALAQPHAAKGLPSAGSAPNSPSAGLRARFGTEMALRLAQSTDPDERLRGLERAADAHTPEALSLLERASKARVPGTTDPHVPVEGAARRDPRALLVTVRGLAAWLDREAARAALASIVDAPAQAFDTRIIAASGTDRSGDPTADDAEGAARVLLARQQAAIALAESGNVLALESLIAIARSAGPGQGPALDALAIHPPPPPLLGGVVLTTPATIALAVAVADLRSVDAIESALGASDPALRAAALGALGVLGDWRAADAARTALRDRDARVRLAAGDTLVRLGTPDAEPAVEALVQDDATALDGLRLAQWLQGEGVTKAAAARAVVSANEETRAAAVAALGRQAGGAAVAALVVLAADPAMQGDAACALARSPSAAALSAIEAMGESASLRRMAGRAYFVRRWVRADRSARLDALLGRLAGSSDPRDRVVGVQALVSLGERPAAPFLDDRDVRVRRAAALGAHGSADTESRNALLTHMVVEADEATRQVLGGGLVDGDPAGLVPTTQLAQWARAGGPDAPLAALAFTQRAAADRGDEVETLLASSDPLLRAHVARGLGRSGAHDAIGRLARTYARDGDAAVRRVVVAALSAPGGEATAAPDRRRTLELAARLDPDRIVRWTASRALSASALPRPDGREIAWLRIGAAEGAALPRDVTAVLVQSDGLALPIAFDDEGYALVPGIPPGEALLRLAPRAPAYDPASP